MMNMRTSTRTSDMSAMGIIVIIMLPCQVFHVRRKVGGHGKANNPFATQLVLGQQRTRVRLCHDLDTRKVLVVIRRPEQQLIQSGPGYRGG